MTFRKFTVISSARAGELVPAKPKAANSAVVQTAAIMRKLIIFSLFGVELVACRRKRIRYSTNMPALLSIQAPTLNRPLLSNAFLERPGDNGRQGSSRTSQIWPAVLKTPENKLA